MRALFITGTGRFGKKNTRRLGKFFMPKRPVLSWFCLWFSTNWLGPVCRIPVGRILELKKNDKTINVGMMQSMKRASDMSPFHRMQVISPNAISPKNLVKSFRLKKLGEMT